MKELEKNELMEVDGGGFIGDYLLRKAIDLLIECAIETHERGTLMNMYQVDVKLWN